MTLFVVSRGPQEVWVAAQHGDHLFVYDPHTGLFHRNDPLAKDFYADQELTYVPVPPDVAAQKIAGGVGAYDARAVRELLRRHREDPNGLTPAEVFGFEPAAQAPPRAAERAQALARALRNAEKGTWLGWREYEQSQRSAAYVTASELRTGKVAAVRDLGPLESRVVPAGVGRLVVQVRRSP